VPGTSPSRQPTTINSRNRACHPLLARSPAACTRKEGVPPALAACSEPAAQLGRLACPQTIQANALFEAISCLSAAAAPCRHASGSSYGPLHRAGPRLARPGEVRAAQPPRHCSWVPPPKTLAAIPSGAPSDLGCSWVPPLPRKRAHMAPPCKQQNPQGAVQKE
jgi:hypothetical protein